jgi:hypothetical protein
MDVHPKTLWMENVMAYASDNKSRKFAWRGRNAMVYKFAFPNGIPADGHAILLPFEFNYLGRVKEHSQPDVWLKMSVAKSTQMVCVDRDAKVHAWNKRIKTHKFIHHNGEMMDAVHKYNPYIIDYDGMKPVKTELPTVTALVEHANTLPHDMVLMVNCQSKATMLTNKNTPDEVLWQFKRNPAFKHAIRKTASHYWEVLDKPFDSTTTSTPMVTFILRKSLTKKGIQLLAGKKAAESRKHNGN